MKRRESVATGPNKGIRYETQIYDILKARKLLPDGVTPAGASDKPDGYFLCQHGEYPLEIKDPRGDFSQIELDWVKHQFCYSSRSRNPKFIPLLEKAKFLDEVNKTWTKIPRKFTKPILTQTDRYWDLDNFGDIRRRISTQLIEQFYNSKTPPVNYMQIGGKGFYYMFSDVAKLNVPQLKGEAILRARVKTRDSKKNAYGFLVAIKLVVGSLKPSTHDIEEKAGRLFPFPKDLDCSSGTQKRRFGSLCEFFK